MFTTVYGSARLNKWCDLNTTLRSPIYLFQVLMCFWSVSSLLTCLVPTGYFTFFLFLQFALALSAQSTFTISW